MSTHFQYFTATECLDSLFNWALDSGEWSNSLCRKGTQALRNYSTHLNKQKSPCWDTGDVLPEHSNMIPLQNHYTNFKSSLTCKGKVSKHTWCTQASSYCILQCYPSISQTQHCPYLNRHWFQECSLGLFCLFMWVLYPLTLLFNSMYMMCLLGHDVVYSLECQLTFQGPKRNQHEGGCCENLTSYTMINTKSEFLRTIRIHAGKCHMQSET
jgi:hypothetical protein